MRTSARWAIPAAVAAAVAGGSLLVPSAASASPDLPPTTAAALLRELAAAPPRALSGTVVQTTDLGLPKIPTTGAAGAGADPGSLTDLLAGSTKARVWTDGAQRSRIAVLGNLAETDVVRAGHDVWTWRSGSGTAQHAVVPEHAAAAAPAAPAMTPDQAASAVLAALDPTTRVTFSDTASVAGRSARLLVLQPRDTGSLVGRVVIAVDAATSTPLRVQVFARGAKAPAVQTGFTDVSFTRPSAHDLTTGVPAGTKVQEVSPAAAATGGASAHAAPGTTPSATPGTTPSAVPGARPTVVGTGWTSVLVARGAAGITSTDGTDGRRGGHDGAAGQSAQALAVLQQAARPVSGAFGSGRLLTTALVSVLALDDGRVLVGAVDASALEKAALDPAAKP